MAHIAVNFNEKIYMFGGCQMYNRKRQIREFSSMVTMYDPEKGTLKKVKTNSKFLINPRKNHSAILFCKL